eukprot:1540812-Amphidinium_carterae.1
MRQTAFKRSFRAFESRMPQQHTPLTHNGMHQMSSIAGPSLAAKQIPSALKFMTCGSESKGPGWSARE